MKKLVSLKLQVYIFGFRCVAKRQNNSLHVFSSRVVTCMFIKQTRSFVLKVYSTFQWCFSLLVSCIQLTFPLFNRFLLLFIQLRVNIYLLLSSPSYPTNLEWKLSNLTFICATSRYNCLHHYICNFFLSDFPQATFARKQIAF